MKSAILPFLLALVYALPAMAQSGQLSPEEEARKLREGIDAEVEKLADRLDLEDWQIFYVDSTLTYNLEANLREQKELRAAKVSNTDLYYSVIDKWQEATYEQFRKIFTDKQWETYLNSGARKEKKARDKRAEKVRKAEAGLKNKK